MSDDQTTEAKRITGMVGRLLDRLDDLAADEKESTPLYADLRDELLAFVDSHPEIAPIVRESGYPV